ncbi:hypothetical protein GEMRC1_008654 [Eukaryota sp. GEM-RC1]
MSHTRLDPKTIALLNRIASERRALLTSSRVPTHRPPSASTQKLPNRVSALDLNRNRPRSVGQRTSPVHLPDAPPSLPMGVTGRSVGVLPEEIPLNHYHRPSTAPREDTRTADNRGTSDGVLFAESSKFPNVPIVYRTTQAKHVSPERLNLDRRRLNVFPIIEGEYALKLLNLQHNNISSICHLNYLNNLIFLDLYDNQIIEISGLDDVTNLKVLMLGRNRITTITGLDCLSKLDVLDLHSNFIETISGLDNLTHLRVLNLAGNRIQNVNNLNFCSSLTELNLRRNHIVTVSDLHQIEPLSRLFLSSNQISSFADVSTIFLAKNLVDFTIDSNPVCEIEKHICKTIFFKYLSNLKHYNLESVNSDELEAAKFFDFNPFDNPISESSQSELIVNGTSDYIDSDDEEVSINQQVVNNPTSDMSQKLNDSISGGIFNISMAELELFSELLSNSTYRQRITSEVTTLKFIDVTPLDLQNFKILFLELFNLRTNIKSIIFDSGFDSISALIMISFLFENDNVTSLTTMSSDSDNFFLIKAFVAFKFSSITVFNGIEISSKDRKLGTKLFSMVEKTAETPKFQKFREQSKLIVQQIVAESLSVFGKISKVDDVINENLSKECQRLFNDVNDQDNSMAELLLELTKNVQKVSFVPGVSLMGKK